jgi:hypothetical protein
MNKNYNKIKTFVALFLITVFVTQFFTSCKKDDDISGAVPEIQYIRVNDPLKSDSLLVSAALGDVIVLVGNNLSNVQEIWFNDQQTKLNTSYITDATIVLTVPSEIPQVVKDSLTIVAKSGIRVQYPFVVQVPPPFVNSMKCEYVADERQLFMVIISLKQQISPWRLFFLAMCRAKLPTYN